MKKNTKQVIFENSIILFAENGYKQTSLRDIADSVGIKVGSIYNHFASKTDIINAIIDEIKNKYNVLKYDEINLNQELDKNLVKKIIENISPFFSVNDYMKNRYFLLILDNERYYNEDIKTLVIDKYKIELEKICLTISKICEFNGLVITEPEVNIVAEIFCTLITYHFYVMISLPNIEELELLQNETIELILHLFKTLGTKINN